MRQVLSLLGVNKKFLILRGIFGVAALTTFFITIQNIPLASAVTFQYVAPLFASVFAIFILKEYIKKWQWLFFIISFVGVFILKGFDPMLTDEYMILGIVSAIFTGLAYNCVRKLKDTDHPLVVVFYFPLIAIPIVGIACLFNWKTPEGMDWIYIIIAGICTQIGQVYMTRALQSETLARITLLKYIGAIYALIIGYVVFDETYQWAALGGILLVVSGVLLNLVYTVKKKTTDFKN